MAWVSHYIHLNPVRGGLWPMAGLSDYRWSSYWYLAQKKQRPLFLNLQTCLAGAGNLKDTPAGRVGVFSTINHKDKGLTLLV